MDELTGAPAAAFDPAPRRAATHRTDPPSLTADLHARHAVTLSGDGPVTLLFVHGLGAHQGLWRQLAPRFEAGYRVARMDLAGCGRAARIAEGDPRYDSIEGHAQDLVAVADSLRDRRLVLVVHSIGCMIGLLADLQAPHLFDAHLMIAPSARYLNEPGYVGGFDAGAIEASLAAIAADAAGWIRAMAPALMGPDSTPEQRDELVRAFAQAQPTALAQFARATFLTDCRARLPQLVKPTLILQCADDPIAPVSVGEFMQRQLPDGRLEKLPTRGHFPHVLAPAQCAQLLQQFVGDLGLNASA